MVAEVVGIAGDVKTRSLEADAGLAFYTPYAQFAWPGITFTIRTAGDPNRLANAARAQIFAVDRNQAVTRVQTLEEFLASALSERRQTLYLIGGFAAVALLLALIGLYGVMSFTVAQRAGEIGIRQAIGAQRGDILRMVLGQGLRLSAAGIVAGGLAALWLTRFLAGMLFHVSATDPVIFAGIAILFLATAMAASLDTGLASHPDRSGGRAARPLKSWNLRWRGACTPYRGEATYVVEQGRSRYGEGSGRRLAGGLAASWVMNQFIAGVKELQRPQEEPAAHIGAAGRRAGAAAPAREPPPAGVSEEEARQREEVDEDATVKTAVAVSEQVLHRPLEQEEKKPAGTAVHYIFGAAMGGLYGMAAEHWDETRTGAGTLFGTALWLAADEVAVPAFN